jgi:hypothetical protein
MPIDNKNILIGDKNKVPDKKCLLNPESKIVVTFNNEEIKCERPDGSVESVKWNDLKAVIIETTDEGPFASDAFWILLGNDEKSGCVYPGGVTGELELLEEMQKRLPNLNNEAVLLAATSVVNNKFLIWKADENQI